MPSQAESSSGSAHKQGSLWGAFALLLGNGEERELGSSLQTEAGSLF